MEQAYAQVLWKLVERGMTPVQALAQLQRLLVSHGREALLSRIARAFARIAERESRKNDMILSVAHEKHERVARHESKEILTALKLDTDGLKPQVDDTLIGGWRLEGKGILVDVSDKRQLLELYNRVTS